MKVSSNFEGGRIEVQELGAHGATLTIPHDVGAQRFRQWFAFDVSGQAGSSFELFIQNAHECTWGDAFGGAYKVFASDGQAWRRLDSSLVGGKLLIRGTHAERRLRLCYYPPYPAERLSALRRRTRLSGGTVRLLGRTPAGRAIECLQLGKQDRPVWVIAQQHPGEAMAGWFVEGLVEFLTGGGAAARALLESVGFAIIPRMNPDGAAIGNHRTTPQGLDLNRKWAHESAPIEVSVTRAAMIESGARFFLDVHGDERLPWVFAQPPDGLPPVEVRNQVDAFQAEMLLLTPDYQTKHRYPYDSRVTPSLAFATNWVHHQFGIPSLTLELPFSDHLGRPDPRGFFPARARRLGARVARGLGVVLMPTR